MLFIFLLLGTTVLTTALPQGIDDAPELPEVVTGSDTASDLAASGDLESAATNISAEGPENGLKTRSTGSTVFKFNSIGEMFKGYDLLKGDPTALSGDPGFRNSIFKATYNNKEKTSDRRYEKPDHTEMMRKTACHESASSEEISSMRDYQKSMKVNTQFDVSGGGVLYQAAFSASVGYSSAENSIVNEKKSIIKTEMSCLVYQGNVKQYPHPEFDPNFLNQLKALGDNPSNLKYKQFLNNFGSHMVKEIFLGASFGKVQTMTKKDKEEMKKTGLDVSASASFSMASRLNIEASVNYEQSKTDQTKFSNSVKETSSYTRGALFPKEGGINEWQKEAFDNPSPVKVTLRSILDVFDFGYFQKLTNNEEKEKFKEIKTGLSNYIKNSYCADALGKNKQRCAGPSAGCDGGNQCSVYATCTDIVSTDATAPSGYECKCKGDPAETDLTPQPDSGFICRPPVKLVDKVLKVGKYYRGGTSDNYGWDEKFTQCKGLAVGLQFKHQAHLGTKIAGTSEDNVGGSGLCLVCDNDDLACVTEYFEGKWSPIKRCPKGSYLSGWRQNVEAKKRDNDDTFLDNVEYTCRSADGKYKETEKLNPVPHEASGQHALFGRWSQEAKCPRNQFICAVRGKVGDMNTDGFEDDRTGINDLQHKCCRVQNL